MNTLVAAALAAAVLNTSAMTMSEKVTVAVEDPAKIAEVMPMTPLEQEKFKIELMKAVKTMLASQEEKAKKKKEIAYELGKFPAAAPINFTGAEMLNIQTAVSNRVEFEEFEMDYGLWRTPRTMDKNKRYYPGWRRGSGPKGSNNVPMKEPDGYPWQTTS